MNAPIQIAPVAMGQQPVFTYPLHWAQKDAVGSIADDLDAGRRRLYVDMPTGTGKTAIPLTMMEFMRSAGRTPRVLIMTKTRQLVGQILEEIGEFTPQLLPSCSRYVAADKDMKTPVAVSTYASGIEALGSGALSSKDFDFIVLDEAHCALSDLRDAVLQSVECPLIALTATPDFNARRGLRNAGYHESFHLSLAKAIETKLICLTTNTLLTIDDDEYTLDGVKLVGRSEDYDSESLEPILTREDLVDSVVEFFKSWREPDTGRRLVDMVGIVYCNSIAHAQLMEKHLNEALLDDVPAGVLPARAIWGSMPRNTLKQLIAAHKQGAVRHLVSVDYVIEGYNNRRVESIFNIRPTRSNVVAGQRPGRGSRLDPDNPGKVNKVFDMIYPSRMGRDQVLYTDTLSFDLREEKKQAALPPPARKNFGVAPQITVHEDPRDVEAFIETRNARSVRLSGLASNDILPAVAKAMLQMKPPLRDGAELARAVRKIVDASSWSPEDRKASSDYQGILNVIKGRGCMTADGADYTLTAYAVSCTLHSRLEDLFGETPEQIMQATADDGHADDLAIARAMTAEEELLYDDPDDVTGGEDIKQGMLNIECRDGKGILTGYDGRVFLEEADDDRLTAEDPADVVHARQSTAIITDALGALKRREEYVLCRRFGFQTTEEKTLAEIGDELDINRERVRQIESRAHQKLKHPSISDKLRSVFFGEGGVYTRTIAIEVLNPAYEQQLKVAFKAMQAIRDRDMKAATDEKVVQDNYFFQSRSSYYSFQDHAIKILSHVPESLDGLSALFQRARDKQDGSLDHMIYDWTRSKMSVRLHEGRVVLNLR